MNDYTTDLAAVSAPVVVDTMTVYRGDGKTDWGCFHGRLQAPVVVPADPTGRSSDDSSVARRRPELCSSRRRL